MKGTTPTWKIFINIFIIKLKCNNTTFEKRFSKYDTTNLIEIMLCIYLFYSFWIFLTFVFKCCSTIFSGTIMIIIIYYLQIIFFVLFQIFIEIKILFLFSLTKHICFCWIFCMWKAKLEIHKDHPTAIKPTIYNNI